LGIVLSLVGSISMAGIWCTSEPKKKNGPQRCTTQL